MPANNLHHSRWPFAYVCLLVMLCRTTPSSAADLPTSQTQRNFAVQLTHVCLITPQFDQMQEFYRRLLHLEPKKIFQDYVEFY
jgi:hypothetical protein